MSITAIVPVWNGREYLERLLNTLESQSRPAQEWLIVDNGSTDGAPEMARDRGARVISMGRNAGFAAAVNRGIVESRTEWLAVLNSDVELAPDYFEILTDTGASFATGKILRFGSEPPLIDGTFDVVCRGGTAWRVGNGRLDGSIFSEARPISSPPWTAVLFREELFRKVGLLEESFESYLEDVDFGLRAAARSIRGEYNPAAVAWHRGSASLGAWHPEIVRRMTRNQIFLIARHYSRDLKIRFWWPILVAQSLWGALAVRNGAAVSWMRGLRDGLAHAGAYTADREPKVLERFSDNERIIREFQQVLGFDTYWKLYFFFAGTGAK
jgi:GT2 family glycosyltransferase